MIRARSDQDGMQVSVGVAMALPDVKEKLARLGLEPNPGTPEALAALIQSETAKWARVVKESGAKIE